MSPPHTHTHTILYILITSRAKTRTPSAQAGHCLFHGPKLKITGRGFTWPQKAGSCRSWLQSAARAFPPPQLTLQCQRHHFVLTRPRSLPFMDDDATSCCFAGNERPGKKMGSTDLLPRAAPGTPPQLVSCSILRNSPSGN